MADARHPSDATAARRPGGEAGERAPTVAVVLVNYDGERHLPACLDSLAALDYPRDRLEVVLVDNASRDRSLAVAARYPFVRVLRQESNLGFAEGVNRGAGATDAECLALLNTDMRVDPGWLLELTRQYEPGAGYPCVAGVILDWEGERLDFALGTVNFHGMGDQVGFGERLDRAAIEDGKELLFACGGAMLVERKTFLELGGFDPAYFANFEDVDFGWRLHLTGRRVRLAGGARVFHRHHGTASGFARAQRMLLYERNALRTLVKNVDAENFGRLVVPALLLLVERARLASGSPRRAFDLRSGRLRRSRVDPLALAPLHAVGDVVAGLDSLLAERRRVQALRVIGDAEIFARFGRPFQPLARDDEAYAESMARVADAFALEELFPERSAARAVVLAVGPRSARAWELARLLSRLLPVVLAVPADAPPPVESGVEAVVLRSDEEADGLLPEADVVVADVGAYARLSPLRGAAACRVVDVAGTPPEGADARAIAAADVLLCESAAERDAWRAALTRPGADGARPVEVVPRPSAGADDAALAALRRIVDCGPACLRDGREPPATEAALVAAALRRRRLRASPALRLLRRWTGARTLWARVPQRARDAAEPLLRRLRGGTRPASSDR